MSFWESELGEVTGKAEDAFAREMFKTIPDGTMATAKIQSYENDEYQGRKFIAINWILTGGDFIGRKVSQKLKVLDPDPRDETPEKTRHRGLNMMKLIYQLFQIKPKHAGAPTDEDLAVFHGKEAGIKIRETEPNEKGNQYNWVAEVHPAKGFKCETGTSLVVTHTNTQFANDGVDSALSRNSKSTAATSLDNDIPF